MAAPGQTLLLCFALQAVSQLCGFYQAGPRVTEQVEEGGGREADEREQPEIGGDWRHSPGCPLKGKE